MNAEQGPVDDQAEEEDHGGEHTGLVRIVVGGITQPRQTEKQKHLQDITQV